MPRRARLTAVSIALLAWVSGYLLAGLAAHPAVGSGGVGSGWLPAAWAQRSAAALDPTEWQRLAGPLPYRPGIGDSGRLGDADVGRAVAVIADLGLFFAKLAETDPNRRAGEIWAQSEAAYGAAADDLRADLAEGRFRIVVTEGSSLAVTRRGEEIWIDSDLAGDWDVARVNRARRSGDDWSEVAGLSGLLYDLWRARGSEAGDAWLAQQRKTVDLPPAAAAGDSGDSGASLLTRYGFLKQLFLKASLLRAATADSLNAALWRDRALRIANRIEALLRAGGGTGEGAGQQDPLKSALRDDWAAYQTQIEQTAAERTWLVLAPRRSSSTGARAGDGPTEPTDAASAANTADAAGEADDSPADTALELIVPAGRAGAEDGPTALKERIAELEAARARDRAYAAQLLARTAGAARAAQDAEAALEATKVAALLASQSEAAALAGAQDRAAGYQAEVSRLADELAAARSMAAGAEQGLAGLQRRLTDAQARAATAETVGAAAKDEVARLATALAAARAGSEDAAAEKESLQHEAADLSGRLDQARQAEADLQARLGEAEQRAANAETEAVRLGETLTALQGTADEDRAGLQRQLTEARTRAATAETARATAETVRDAAKDEVSRLAAALAAARAGNEDAAVEEDRLRQEAADLTGRLDQARQAEADLGARLAEAEGRAKAAETEVARLGDDLTTAQSAAAAATEDASAVKAQLAEATAAAADLEQRLADRDATVGRLEAGAAERAAALAKAAAEIAQLQSRVERAQAVAADGEAAAESERAARDAELTDLRSDLSAARTQAEDAARALAASQEEVARLRDAQAAAADEPAPAPASVPASAPASVPASVPAGEPASMPDGGGPWAESWGLAVAIPLLFLAGLGGLLTLVWRRVTRPVPAPAARPTAVAARPTAAPRRREEATARRADAPPPAARPRPPTAATSATIVAAVRRRDWAAADAQFAELSGIAAPRLRELLADPSGELLALACRAADLDRLTFATLYLLQDEGRAVADPDTLADAVSLFERTGPADAHRQLAERTTEKSFSQNSL